MSNFRIENLNIQKQWLENIIKLNNGEYSDFEILKFKHTLEEVNFELKFLKRKYYVLVTGGGEMGGKTLEATQNDDLKGWDVEYMGGIIYVADKFINII